MFAATLFAGLSESIDVLTGATGAMERINGTPLPLCYISHIRMFLVLYLGMLPIVTVERWGENKESPISMLLDILYTIYTKYQRPTCAGWSCILISAVISWALLGIEAADTQYSSNTFTFLMLC